MALSSLDAGELNNVKSALNADNYGNDPEVEMHWAMKTFHHAETHFNLLISVDPALLRLTKKDDEIYQLFRQQFPDLDVTLLNEDQIKSEEGKAIWREFCNGFKGEVEDFNFGTLLRLDSSEDITEKNTTIVPRIQFLAIEIARNREGHNSMLREKFRPQKS